MNLYQSGSRLISKFCNLIGTEHFGPYTRTRFSKVWYLSRNTANNIHFHYEPNSEKTNDQTFQYNQKSHSLAHFQLPSAQLFWLFFFFFKKHGSVIHNFIWVPNNPIQRKYPDRWMMDWSTDRPYLIWRSKLV